MISNSSTICVDSSLVIRLVLGGPNVEDVEKRWKLWVDEDTTLIAPPLLAFEVTSVIWREVYQEVLTPEQGRKALQTALSQDIRIEYPSDLHKRAWDIAHRFNLTQAYDAHFAALAELSDCEFWTLDVKLYRTLRGEFEWVRTIQD